MFMSRQDLETLTGRKTRRGIKRWLDENQWRYEPNARGWPVVLAAYTAARMSGAPVPAEKKGPNIAALKQRA